MNSSVIATARFIAVFLSIAAILGQRYIPEKTLQLYPSETTRIALNVYDHPIYGESASWISADDNFWRCDIPSGSSAQINGCGISLKWGQKLERLTNAQSSSTEVRTSDCNLRLLDNLEIELNQNLRQTCKRAKTPYKESNVPVAPCINPKSDIDGDGFGQEYGAKCETRDRLPTVKCRQGATRVNKSIWGWEENGFCVWGGHKRPAPLSDGKKLWSFADAGDAAIDFTAYKSIRIRAYYEGKASYLRVYLRNANPLYWYPGEHSSSKYMLASVLSEDLTTGPINISLNRFSVSESWSSKYPQPSDLRGPEFAHIIELGVDHVTPGVHKVRLDQVTLVGEALDSESLLFAVAMFWALYLLVESIHQYHSFKRASIERHREVDSLTKGTQKLEKETSELLEKTITDPLTGIFNRLGITQFTDTLFKSSRAREDLCLMIIDIDHFKSVNDTFGHNTGDEILINVSQILSANIRQNDIFGRWGGEEFILICPKTDKDQAKRLAEKLRLVIEQNHLETLLELEITISIGATHVRKNEAFTEAFKRADVALYAAKNERNKMVYQG